MNGKEKRSTAIVSVSLDGEVVAKLSGFIKDDGSFDGGFSFCCPTHLLAAGVLSEMLWASILSNLRDYGLAEYFLQPFGGVDANPPFDVNEG